MSISLNTILNDRVTFVCDDGSVFSVVLKPNCIEIWDKADHKSDLLVRPKSSNVISVYSKTID
jgi:hypothetical protein